MISGALKLATQKPTDATKKATGKQPIATPKPPLADTIQSLLGSTGPVQGPVENPIRQTMRKAEEFKVRQAKLADQKKKWAQNNPLTINSPFGEVKFTMDPEIADQYRNGDVQTKIGILNQYNQRVIEEGVRLGKSPLPQFRNTDIGKALAGRFSTGMENIPQDERFRYEPYTPGDVVTEAGRFAGNVLTMMPGTLFNARATNPKVFEPVSVAAGMAAQDAFKLGKRVAPDYNLFGSISVNELLNPAGQGLQAVSDITNPEAGFGTTAGALTGVVASLTPGLEGAGVIVNALRAGKKFAPALVEGLVTAGREGVIGWNTIERKIRAKDIANILEKAGTFNEAGYFLRQTERADFIRRLQEDAKAWARKNSKNENEFLEKQDEFYKNLLRPVLNNYPPTGVNATKELSRGATADFQPAISGPVRMSTRAGELTIPEAERYQQIIPDFVLTQSDDDIEQSVMNSFVDMVQSGVPEDEATTIVANAARVAQQSNNNIDANKWLKDNGVVVEMSASRFNRDGDGSFYYTFKDKKTKKILTQIRMSNHGMKESSLNHPNSWSMDASIDPESAWGLDLDEMEFAANRVAAEQGKPLPFPNYDRGAPVFDKWDINPNTFKRNQSAPLESKPIVKENLPLLTDPNVTVARERMYKGNLLPGRFAINVGANSPDKQMIGKTGWYMVEESPTRLMVVNERTGDNFAFVVRNADGQNISRVQGPIVDQMMGDMRKQAIAFANENKTNPLTEDELATAFEAERSIAKSTKRRDIQPGTEVQGTLPNGETITGKLSVVYDKMNNPTAFKIKGRKVDFNSVEPVGGFDDIEPKLNRIQIEETPVTVYHGTTTEFEGIPSAGMSRTGAIHVTPNRAFAEQFTDINQGRAIGETPTVKEFNLDPSKVADLRQPDLKQDFIDFVVKKYGMKKPDPFDDEWEVINTGVFDPEGFRGNSKGISVDDLSDDIDQGAYWVAESKAAKDWAESRGYAGVKAIEGESGHGVETFAIFDPKVLGMETPKPTPKIQKWLDGNDTRIAELEKRTSGRMYSGIDPDVVELAARRAIKTSYLAGVSLVEAVKQQFDNLKLLFAGDGLDLELEAQYLDEIENQSRLLMQTTELPSSMDLVVRTEKIDEVLPGAQVKMKKEDAAKLLEKYTRDLLENPEGIKLTNENREVIVRVLANTLKKETIAAIKSGGEGQGFYSLSIDDANDALDQLFPGITDTQKKLFHIISAPASSGNTPMDESAYGIRLLEEYLQTGKFKAQVKAKNTIYDSTGKLAYNVGDTLSGPGTRAKGIVASHETMKKVFDYFGNDPQKTLDFFLTEWPEDKFREYYKILKGGSPSLKDLEAGPNGGYYGTLLLGPKVGQYALNKLGLGGTTKDLWFYRMVNRIAGSLVFKNKELVDEIFEAGFLSKNSIGKQVSNEATALAAKELGISERVLQEITWANEQKIYKSLGVQRRGGSIRDGVEKIAKEQGVKLKPLDPAIKAKAQAAIDAEQAKVLEFTKNDPLYGTTKGNIEKNRERIAELEGLIQSKTKSLGGNRQRGAYVPPTKEELELLARRALNMVYTGGEKIADAVKSLAKGFGMPEGQENAIFDAIRKIDPEAVKDIPTTTTTETTTKTPDLIATANRITADVRRSVGLDDVNKVSPEQIADWEEEARKINTEKLMDDMLATNKLRPLTKSEELAMGARLSRALERYDAAQKVIEDADFVTTDMLDRAQSAREEILKISDFTNAVGAEWGRAGVARQALIRADYTTAGVISKIKKAEVAASKAGTKEVRASTQQIADAEEFAKQAREKDAKIAELEKKIEDLRAQGAKEAPKRRIEARRKRLESEADDILAQIFQARNRPSPGIKQGPEKGAVSIDIEKNAELMNLYGKLAKNFIQRGALNIEDVYTSVSEIAKQAGHAITKQGLIDALDQQMVRRRTRQVRGATKAEIRQRQKLNREIAKGSTRGQEAAAKAVAGKEVIRKAREEALALKKAENEAKRQAIRAEKQAANAQAKAEADAYRAEAKTQREEARRLAKEQRKVKRQAKIDARQARREELNQALGPIARDERKIANLKGRIEDYNRMIETGEFFASRPLKEGDEGYELTHLQEQVDLLRYEAKMAKMNVDGIIDDISQPKWVKVMKEVVGLPRYFQLGLDAGALTRQGFDIALVSPKAWTKAAKAGFGAAISNPANVAKMEEEFMQSPEVLKAIANGLAIDGPSEFPEGFVSKFAAKVPGYGRGERFHKTFQNFARFEAYKNLTRNQNLNQYQLKEVAKLINAMTGRGSWKGAEGPLASIFTAPKMYAGQLEVMGKTAIAAVDKRFYTNPAYRKLIVRRWLGRMGGLVALKTLADATDWEFSINPDDSDFLKLRNGDVVIDVTGGYSSWYKLLFSTLNDIAEQGASESFYKKLTTSLGYKISPTVRGPISLITGKDAIGNPFFVNPDTGEREMNVKDLAKTFAPLIGVQLYEMAGGDEGYQDMDLGAKVGLGALGFVGTGVSKYPARESRRPVEETKWGQLLDQIGVQPR